MMLDAAEVAQPAAAEKEDPAKEGESEPDWDLGDTDAAGSEEEGDESDHASEEAKVVNEIVCNPLSTPVELDTELSKVNSSLPVAVQSHRHSKSSWRRTDQTATRRVTTWRESAYP